MKIRLLGATLAIALSQPVLAENQEIENTCLIGTVKHSFEWNDKNWIDTGLEKGEKHGDAYDVCGIKKCLEFNLNNLISFCSKPNQITGFIQGSDERSCQFFAYVPADRVFYYDDHESKNIVDNYFDDDNDKSQGLDAIEDNDVTVSYAGGQNLHFGYSYDDDINILLMHTNRGSEEFKCEDALYDVLNTQTYDYSDYDFDNPYQELRAMGIEKIAIIDSATDITLKKCSDNKLCWVDAETDEEINPGVSFADISNEDVWVKDDDD